MEKEWKKVEQADVHDFKEEKELVGTITLIEEGVGSNNSMLYTVRREDDSTIAFWGSAILDTRLKNVSVGDEVKIVYLGKKKSEKSGRSYHDFEVYHIKAEGSPEGEPEKPVDEDSEEEIKVEDIPF